MANMRRASALGAIAATSALVLTACSSTEPDASASEGSKTPVTLTWWHNGVQDPLLTFWEDVADEFEAANPHVTIEVSAIQNEDLQRTRLPVALQSGDAPDLFQQWGGGEMVAMVESGHLKDISAEVADDLDRLGGVVSPWQVDGVTYGLPYTFGPEGIWYRPSLFEAAGITELPSTMDELDDAVEALKDAGIAPIAVGALDSWPAAHWWYNFAVASCSPETLAASGTDLDFSDPCFVQAGEYLEDFLATEPFQEGFAGTTAQQGATSSAGLVANGNAAMELMGHWNIYVMRDLSADAEAFNADIGWFPFPAVTGAQGDPTAILGGGDGFSCYVDAPDECVDFLKYIVSDDVQTRYAEIVGAIPVAPAAVPGVTDDNLLQLIAALNEAGYVQLWLDTTYGSNIGGAMNLAIEKMFSGIAVPQDVVDAMVDAAANQ